jgi:HEAT repeat protein
MGLTHTFAHLDGLLPEQRLLFLVAAIDELHEGVQLAAVRALADPQRAGRPDLVVDRFADLLPSARAEVAQRAAEFVPIARERIASPHDRARRAAYRLLADLAGDAAIDLLAPALADPADLVREVAVAGLEARLRAALAPRDGAALPDDAQCASARAVLAAALPRYGAHGRKAFVELLVAMGARGLPLVKELVLAPREPTLQRAFAAELAAQAGPGAVDLLFHMALDADADVRSHALAVLRTRRDVPFGQALAAWLIGVTEPAMVRALLALRDVPWVPIVAAARAQLEPAVAVGVLDRLAACALEPPQRQAEVEAFLQHGAPAVRRRAVEIIAALRCPAGFAAIERAVADADDGVRLAAAQALVDLAHKARTALLTPLLGAACEELRAFAMREIGKVSFARFLRHYDAMDEKSRQVVARALAKIDPSMLDRLGEEIGSSDPDRRLKALRMIEFVEAEAQLHEPLRELLHDPDKRVRATAVRIAELTGSPADAQLLVAALGDPDKRVRANAIEAIEGLEDRRYVALLTPFLRDRDNRVRANAAKALWHLGWSEARDELADMLEDDDEAMRVSAAWAIGQIGFDGARELLERRAAVERSGRVGRKIHDALASLAVASGGTT